MIDTINELLQEFTQSSGWLFSALMLPAIVFLISFIKDVLKYYGFRKHLANRIKGDLREFDKIVFKVVESSIPYNSLVKYLIKKFNFSLMTSISIMAEDIINAPEKFKKSKTVVGLMLGEKLKNSSKAQLFFMVTIFVDLIISKILDFEFSGFVMFVSIIGILGIHIDHKLIENRIRKGVYGTNYFESKELIEFISAHSNKDDFNDSGGLKKIIPTPEIAKEKESEYIVGGIRL